MKKEKIEMYITIDNEKIEVLSVSKGGYLPEITTEDGNEYLVSRSSLEAGEAAREYWEDMIETDPEEFICLVGEETLLEWGLGNFAGPGTAKVCSVQEWLRLWIDVPEEQWAYEDGVELKVSEVSTELEDELGFVPTVAYRTR